MRFAGISANAVATPHPEISDWKFLGYPNNSNAVFQIDKDQEAFISKAELMRVSDLARKSIMDYEDGDDTVFLTYSVRTNGSSDYDRKVTLCSALSIMTLLNGLNGLNVPQYKDGPGIW